jgi:hypothetical protein
MIVRPMFLLTECLLFLQRRLIRNIDIYSARRLWLVCKSGISVGGLFEIATLFRVYISSICLADGGEEPSVTVVEYIDMT